MANPSRKKATGKRYQEMTASELQRATAEFDQEFAGDTFGPPSAKQREQWERAKHKRGRPRVGDGAKTISVTVEARLLAKTDRLAKKLQVPRAAIIARGLQAMVQNEVSM
jgi:hypothetical protein